MIGNYLRITFFCSFSFLCCSSSPTKKIEELTNVIEIEKDTIIAEDYHRVYDFETPLKTSVLDDKLEEISGLTYDVQNNIFLAINDEEGVIYSLGPSEFEIVAETKFYKKGDYEAIALLDDYIVVSKSSGKLYFNDILSKKTTVYNTKLNGHNNIEGLCFDIESNALLIACKEQPMNGGNLKDLKCVYRFDLETKKLDKNPFLKIYDSQLLTFVESMELNVSKSKLKKLKRKVKNFAPSGIAIHPVTGAYYLTSGRGSILVIIDKNKQLRDIVFLNDKTNPQPEGITFDKGNNLYISTEGKGFSGKVFKYDYKG